MEPNANAIRLVSHYQIIMNPIGQGSYGAIYQARDLNNPQELLACKQVQCQLNRVNPRFVQIITEYQILKKISYQQQTHPNIVRMIEGLNQKGADVIYIFLEYCNEGDLENYIKHNWKKYSEKQILSIFQKIFSGCQYLQSESIMHRDILLKDGQPKICDFGTAIEYTLDTQARFAGTPEYRAPELDADRGFYSEQAEVFSLGQILYQMIYNTTLGAKSSTQTLELQDFFDDVLQYKQFVFPQEPVISNELKQLLMKMLAYNPEQRAKFSDIQKFFWQREQQNLRDSGNLVETQINQQNVKQIADQFTTKLSLDQDLEWIKKFETLQTQNMQEVCCYYQHILPLMISSSEVQQIQIELNNAKRGGFANIHYGFFRGQKIAIKEQIFQSSQDYVEFISMLREISILIFCNHPNITKILAVYFNPQQLKIWTIQPRYAMDLHEALFEQGKQIPNKQEILLQLLSALDYIHSLKFVHLDIKPKNIMFESQNLDKICLLDFGVTKLEKNSQTDVLGISYFYSAPEVSIIDKSLVSSKSDMFSFGIVLYELFTARRAWQNSLGKGGRAIYDLIKGNFDFFKENPRTGNANLDNFILACVEKNPQKRPTALEAIGRLIDIQF